MSLIAAARGAGEAIGEHIASGLLDRARAGFAAWEQEQAAGTARMREHLSRGLAIVDSVSVSTSESSLTPESIRRAYDRG